MAELDDNGENEVEPVAGKPAPLGGLRRRGIYLLPNLFTTLNLFAGFYAIVQGMNHDFEKASIAIFVAMVLDSIDGRVAVVTVGRGVSQCAEITRIARGFAGRDAAMPRRYAAIASA